MSFDKKKRVREQIKSTFLGMSPMELQEKSSKLSLKLKRFFSSSPRDCSFFIHQLKYLGGFAPLKDEVDWATHWPFKNGVKLAFPSFTRKPEEMAFVISSFEDLNVDKTLGVKIPKSDAPRVIPEVLLVPGRAFTAKGDRLGRGKGLYDRYLASYPGLKIGICLSEQIVGELPLEEHDIPMDCIVTDETIFAGGKIWN